MISWFGFRQVGVFEGVPIYESERFGTGYRSTGLCLPGIGIFIGEATFQRDIATVRHEFGHILQARKIGYLSFYIIIGILSLISASTAGFSKGHQNHWVEGWCNHLARDYFSLQGIDWDERRFPPKNIKPSTLRWIKWKI
jgi:hypothetical protein